MISSLSGKVIAHGDGFVVINIGGIGFRVETPKSPRSPRVSLGEEVFFHTAFIVREDAMTLYGFETETELEVFTLLTSVSGVGPKSALGVLSSLGPGEIVAAVTNEDEKPFRAVSGIGPKTAKLILVSLNGKFKHLDLQEDGDFETAPPAGSESVTVIAGLVSLGWSETLAKRAAQQAAIDSAGEGVQAIMKEALKLLQTPEFIGGQR